MARYKSWKTSLNDMQEFNRLLSDAGNAVRKARESLTEDVGFTEEMVDELLPEIGTFQSASKTQLNSEFATRADFNRYKRYLGRIARAGEAKPRIGTISIAPDNPNNLTSFYLDENGSLVESAFMRSEQKLQIVNRNRAAREGLKSRGVDMVKKEVLEIDSETGNYVPVRDEWGHVVTTWLPASPNNRDLYLEEIEKDASMSIVQPDEAIGGYVDMFGDVVPVTQAKKHRMSPRALAESQEIDARTDSRNTLYFSNYEAIVETTLPTHISEELSGYIDAVQELPPPEKAAIYEYINENGEDAGSIEYLYLDSSGELPNKIHKILSFWRGEIAPKLKMKPPEGEPSLAHIQEQLSNSGYILGSGQQIYGEYQRRREEGTATYATLESMSGVFGTVMAPPKKGRKRGKK